MDKENLTPPNQVIREINDSVAQRNLENSVIQQASDRNDERAQILQKHIYDLAHPNPVIVALCIIGFLVMLWIFYLIFIKPNMSGEWYDAKGDCIVVSHNLLTNSVLVKRKTDKTAIEALVLDNLFKMNDHVGVWDYNNSIVFIDGPTLTRVRM